MRRSRHGRFTVVSFHAHPDDEALLTAGTLAKVAACGHRVVLVTATAGEAGLAASDVTRTQDLGTLRLGELHAAASAIGVARVVVLGYADSGYSLAGGIPSGEQGRAGNGTEDARTDRRVPLGAFVDADRETAAIRLAELLRAEDAHVLTIYDRHGGYGHPDHVQVHRVGLRAAELAGTRLVLEATVDRTSLTRATRLINRLRPVLTPPAMPDLQHAYTSREALTHRIDVRAQAGQKRAAMAAHASQMSSNEGARTLDLFLRLPRPVFRRVFRYEWFREVGSPPQAPLLDDIFVSLTEKDNEEDEVRGARTRHAERP